MRFVAAAAVALAVGLLLAGCGGSGTERAITITVDLPSARPADDVIGPGGAGGRHGDRSGGPSGRDGHAAGAAGAPGSAAGAAGAPGSAAGAATASRTVTPAIVPLAPAADARLDGVSVWVPYWGLTAALGTVLDNPTVVRVAHPFLDEITHSSTVLDESGGQADAISSELAAAHVEVIPTVTETAPMGAFAATLSNPKRQTALLDALEGIAEQPGNDGIDLDFENMAIGTGSTQQAETVQRLYPQLVARLCADLHRSDRSCEVTVMAKNDAGLKDSDGLDTAVYDYAALAQVADRIQLMAYDDHTPGGAAGPIAPWPWVESVVDYALTQIPAGKLVLGIPAYGYDWSSDGAATSLTAVAAEQLGARMHAPLGWNGADAEPYFRYATGPKQHRVHHTVWFEDATAIYDRAVLAADDRLAGIAIWAAGDEPPGVWPMLARLR